MSFSQETSMKCKNRKTKAS